MSEAELMFLKKWNEMLQAAKEMEKEGKYTTGFGFELRSANEHILDRQKLTNAMNGKFLDNGYRLGE